MSILSTYIGPQYDAFARVCLAFVALGYNPPRPDTNADGAYVSNLVTQYQSDLSPRAVIAIVRFALAHSKEHLAATATWGPRPNLTELVDQYNNTQEQPPL